jgi:hypothetical protein
MWSLIELPTTEEAQQHRERIPAWADFRHFMDLTFADAMRYTQQIVSDLDPAASPSSAARRSRRPSTAPTGG